MQDKDTVSGAAVDSNGDKHEADSSEETLLEAFRRGKERWTRVDALHELLEDVLSGTKDMPLITLTVRLPDGSAGKMDLDLNLWEPGALGNVAAALLEGLAKQWVDELGGFVSDGAKLYRIYRPQPAKAVPRG